LNTDKLRVRPSRKLRLADHDPADTLGLRDRDEAQDKLERDILRLRELHDVFHAARQYSLLVVLQALDTAGKDGVIKHVISGLNPQSVRVSAFRAPSSLELTHDFLWRHAVALPGRGEIGIFNRSHYEEVLTVRVHPELLARQRLPPSKGDIWQERFEDINTFERHLARNGMVILKFFLHLSRDEQRQRLLARIDEPDKNWKFEPEDMRERGLWDQYHDAFEDALRHTSTEWAPWYVVPADRKWLTRVAVADVLVRKLESLKLEYPTIDDAQRAVLAQAREELLREG
jgi:PPK2 family polyphosphate:nucleotide phosphotransferase